MKKIFGSIPQWAMGMLLGIVLMFLAFSAWEYAAQLDRSEDRNKDGKPDAVFSFSGGTLWSAKFDDDFDGYFERVQTYNRHGVIVTVEVDRNKDGKPDLIEHYTDGQLESVEVLDPATGKVKKRVFYTAGVKTREEIDADGDGKFEKTVQFDQPESPKP